MIQFLYKYKDEHQEMSTASQWRPMSVKGSPITDDLTVWWQTKHEWPKLLHITTSFLGQSTCSKWIPLVMISNTENLSMILPGLMYILDHLQWAWARWWAICVCPQDMTRSMACTGQFCPRAQGQCCYNETNDNNEMKMLYSMTCW